MIIPGFPSPMIKVGPSAPVPFTTSWKYASAFTDSGGNYSWTSETNIYAANGSDAQVASNIWGPSQDSNTLTLTGFGFTTSDVAAGATILGVEVEMQLEISGTGGFAMFSSQRLVIGGAGSGSTYTNTNFHGSPTTLTKGGAADLWGTSVTAANIVASNFGTSLKVSRSGSAPVNVQQFWQSDYIRMRVHGEI